MITAVRANLPRFEVGTDHVESWFVRANDPSGPRAVWMKATVLTRKDGSSLVQAWCNTFDGDRTHAFCTEVALADAVFTTSADASVVDLGILRLELAPDSVRCIGALEEAGASVTWDLTLTRLPGLLGVPLSLLPSDRLIDGPLPKNKLLTPFPSADCTGSLTLDGATWDLAGWSGMQGHNWGAAHSPEYAWGQCLFTEAGTTIAMVEAASGRIELGRRRSPLISMLVVRHLDQEYRFDRLLDLWRQHPAIEFPRWTLSMSGRQGRVDLEMVAAPERMVRLDYVNPARATSYCLNSKTAEVRLSVTPSRGDAFTLTSVHGGALEFLSHHRIELPDKR